MIIGTMTRRNDVTWLNGQIMMIIDDDYLLTWGVGNVDTDGKEKGRTGGLLYNNSVSSTEHRARYTYMASAC